MPERTSYAPGIPSWIDIGTDVEAAKAFYTGLFGWSTADAGPVEETGGYGFFTTAEGKMLAGYGPQQNPGPPFWTTYIATDDADASAARVEAAGGTVVVPPMDVMDAGRMAVFQDTEGAFFSVWQAGRHLGAEVVNEPGAFCWSELSTRDPEAAKAFYAAVFGWGAQASESEAMAYTEWQLGGESIGGMMDMPPMVPVEVPAYWLVYFAVEDTDASVARAKELGATALLDGQDTPAGRIAVLADPQGATFALIALVADL